MQDVKTQIPPHDGDMHDRQEERDLWLAASHAARVEHPEAYCRLAEAEGVSVVALDSDIDRVAD